MTLKRVRMELARSPGFPDGSARHGYEFVAPINEDGQLDASAWRENRKACTVRRFWADEPQEEGLLRHSKKHWYFDYDDEEDADDEPLFKLDRHQIVEGEYLSVTEQDGKLYAFKIKSVRPA